MPYRLLLLAVLLFSPLAGANDPRPQDYGYPLTNPFTATIVNTPPGVQASLPDPASIDQADYAVRLPKLREQALPDAFWAVRTLRYRLARQDRSAPLVFLIAGTGAPYDSRLSETLKLVFYQAGYHVVQLSSPTSFDFMASASRLATPGYMPEDARDLYRVMKAIRARHTDLPVSDFRLAGYSLGGLHAAFVAQLDETEQAFNFRRVLLLNPPVDLYASARNLDRLVQVRLPESEQDANFYEQVLDKLSRYFRARGHIDLDAALLHEFQRSPYQLSNEQMAMLIGAVFRLSAADIAFASDAINRRGLFLPISAPLGIGSNLEPLYKQALTCDFRCYIDRQLLPMWREQFGGGAAAQLVAQTGMPALEDFLARSPQIAVMHNADDLILSPGDLSFLKRTFGPRLRLYPYGGHCGNYSYPTNVRDMLELLRD